MELRPAALLGWPSGSPDLVFDMVSFRWGLVFLALAWSALAARSRPLLVLAGGGAFVGVAVGFWILALERPYGLLLDPDTTRWVAQVSVTVATGDASEGFLSGTPAEGTVWSHLIALGLPADLVLVLPSWLPLLALTLAALSIRLLWRVRDRSLLGACLWLGFSTGDLDSLRGTGFVSAAWSHAEAALAFVPLVAAVLGAGRLIQRNRTRQVLCAVLVGAWALFPATASPRDLGGTVLLLTLDQGPWLVLALVALRRGVDAATGALMAVGALLVVSGAWPLGTEIWGSHGLYRLGLILAATGPLQDIAVRAGRIVGGRWLFRGLLPERIGLAALLALFVPGSFLSWWDPQSLDPLAQGSLQPLSTNLRATMERVGRETAPDGVFLVGADYAPYVAVLAGRRVLLAPSLVDVTPDQERRRRAERRILSGRDPGRLGRLYGLRYVLIAPGDYREYGIMWPRDLDTRRTLRLKMSAPGGLEVYEIEAPRAQEARRARSW